MVRNSRIKSIIKICSITFLIILGTQLSFIYPIKSFNASASSVWIENSSAEFDKGTMKNIVLEGDDDNFEMKLDLFFNWTDMNPGTKPSGRVDHMMEPIYNNDKALLFSGYDGGVRYEDTWVYDYSNHQWTRKYPSINPGYANNQEMAAVYNTDKVILCNGQTWEYDLSDDEWVNKAPSAGPMTNNHKMATIYGTDKILLFGGGSGNPPANQTWTYDLSENRWVVKATNNFPPERWGHAMAMIHGTDKVLLFGGRGQFTQYWDTWIYDLSENDWTEVVPPTSPANRYNHDLATIWDTDKVVLFGGQGSSLKDDTWVYDLSENEWITKTPATKPARRDRLRLAMVWGTYKVVMFGGWNGNNPDDTNVFEHGYQKTGYYESIKFDTGDWSGFKNISWLAETPENTKVQFRIRTGKSYSGVNSQDFVGPDGKTSSFYTNNPSEIWSGHTYDRWVQYKAYLSADTFDTPILREINITYNKIPKTTLKTPINGRITSNYQPTFTWEFSDPDSSGQSAFQVLISNNIDFEYQVYDSGEQISTSQEWQFPKGTNYDILPDGTFYWKVRIKDSDNNWGFYSEHFSITIDTTINRPVNVIVDPVSWTSKNLFKVSWDNPYDLSGIIGAYYKLDLPPFHQLMVYTFQETILFR